MHYLKLDAALLESSLWVDFDASRVFVAAALMAEPDEISKPTPQLAVRSLEPTGWMVPPGWYGIVRAAGPGIVRRALLDPEPGLNALERLGQPDPESRSADYEGRRLVRIDGGYVVLNLMRFREKDTTAAERMKRYRANKKRRRPVTPSPTVTGRNVTQAVAEADADVDGEADRKTTAVGGKNTATKEIAEARKRYTPSQLAVIDDAVAGFATTRKSGKVADSVVAAEYRWWASFPAEQVAAGLQTYLTKKYAAEGKGEKYARGIIRRTDPLTAMDSISPAVPSAGNDRGVLQPDWGRKAMEVWRACAGEILDEDRFTKVLGPVHQAVGDVDRLCFGLAKWLRAGNARFGVASFVRDWRGWVPGGQDGLPSRTDLELAEFLAEGRADAVQS